MGSLLTDKKLGDFFTFSIMPSTKRASKRNVHPRKVKRNGAFAWFFGRRMWGVWIGVGLAGIAYVFLFYHFLVTPFSLRWKAFYGEVKHPEGFSIQGIDISHYQQEINWRKLREATIEGYPLRFVIIKATEGESLLDDNFNDNFYQAREYGLIRGAYHYFIPNLSAERQARYFLKQVHLEKGDIPPILDIEVTGGLDVKSIQKAALKWLDIVERHYGVKPILYTGYKFKMTYLRDSIFNTYPYWIAHYYVDSIQYKGEWKFWQHTDCGRINGIKGPVDFNVYNGSMYDLLRFTIKKDPRIKEEEE